MYRKVLAAVNEHVNSEVAARYAMHLARAAGPNSSSTPSGSRTDGGGLRARRDASKRLQHHAREIDIDAECLFETGDPVEKIARSSSPKASTSSSRHAPGGRQPPPHQGGTTARRLLPGLPAPWRSSVSCTWAGSIPTRSSSHSRIRSITSRALRVHRPACKGLRGQGPSLSCDQACEEVLPRRDAPDPWNGRKRSTRHVPLHQPP